MKKGTSRKKRQIRNEDLGIKRIRDAIQAFVKKKDVTQKILKLRGQFIIPNQGLEIEMEKFSFKHPESYLPEKWHYYSNSEYREKFNKEVKKLAQNSTSFQSTKDFFFILRFYIFHNEISEYYLDYFLSYENMCKIIDKDFLTSRSKKDILQVVADFPVLIGVRSESGQNDIVRFVTNKGTYKYIEKLQDKYKKSNSEVSNTRAKDHSEKIKKIIRKNKDLSSRELSIKINDKLGSVTDDVSVRKIKYRS